MEWREAQPQPSNHARSNAASHHMQKLRGSGATFSTSGQDWKPFRFNPKIAARAAKLHRLKRKGLLPPIDKASLRAAALAAANVKPT